MGDDADLSQQSDLLNGQLGAELELNVEDPGIFTAPWSANVTYRRVMPGFNEGACAENNVDMFHSGDLDRMPTARTPDF